MLSNANMKISLDRTLSDANMASMEQDPVARLIDLPDEDMMGPAMLALEPKQRRFVAALGVFGGDQCAAYQWAGYKTTNERALSACSSRLAGSDKVQQAIREEATRRMGYAPLLVASGLMEMASPVHNPDRTTRLKALVALADRVGMAAKSEVNHTLTIKDDRTTREIEETIRQLQIANGFNPTIGLPLIEAEYEEVVMDSTGLEDLF